MPFFKRKTEVACVTCDVPGWKDLQIASLVKEWALCSESSENWDGKLQSAQPPQVIEVLLSVPVEKGDEL